MADIEQNSSEKGKSDSTSTPMDNSETLYPICSMPTDVVMTDEERDLAIALQNYTPNSDAEKKLVRKVDMMLIPTVWFMYILAVLDRSNLGNAKLAGMGTDLGLTDDNYAFAVSIFFIGYLICEVPSNLVLTRSRPSLYLSTIMVLWGGLACCMAALQNYRGILALRFFLGCMEAGFFPGVLFLMSCWYKKNEIGKRFSIFYTASVFAGALGGLLAGAITGHLDGARGIEGWRWLFIIEGCVTIVYAIFVCFFLLDFPATSRRFSIEERQLAVVRIIYDKQTSSARHSMKLTHYQALKAALADPRTYIFTILAILQLGSTTIVYFIPTIVADAGYKSVTAQYMTIPIWMVAAVLLIIVSYTADRTGDRRWHITGCMAVSFISCIVCIASSNAAARYAMLCFFIAGLYVSLPLILTWTQETVSLPAEKRAVTMAFVNSVGNLASVYGSRLWPAADQPRYIMGFATVAGLLGVGIILAALIPVIVKYLPLEGTTKAEKEILRREEMIVNGTGFVQK